MMRMVVLAGLLLALPACRGRDAERTLQPPALAVRVRAVPVTRADLPITTVLIGTLEPWQRATLAARVAGDVASLAVDRGDRVRRGQVLATIRVPGAPEQRAEAAAAARAAARELAEQKEVADRLTEVAGVNAAAVAAQELAVARERVAAAEARSQAAAAGLRRADALLQDTRILAPFDGVVVARRADLGSSVAAGAPLLDLAQLDPLRLTVDVPEQDTAFVWTGAPVVVTLPALGERQIRARVSRFAPALDPASRMLRAEIDVPNDGTLVAGCEARVRLQDAVRRGALTVPAEALIVQPDATVVFVLHDGRARRVPVRRGYDDGVRIEVLEGLAGKEEVLIGARGLIADGTAVEVAQ